MTEQSRPIAVKYKQVCRIEALVFCRVGFVKAKGFQVSCETYIATPDVDEFGFLHGGEDSFPVKTSNYRWWNPYPTMHGRLELYWERGASKIKPNIFAHNLLHDFVCDRLALKVIMGLATSDLRIIGRALMDGEELSIVQAVTVLDVVDEHHSIPSPYSWAKISFPHVPPEKGNSVRRRIFRIPYPELSLKVLVGEDVKEAYENAGLRGWSFESAQVEE